MIVRPWQKGDTDKIMLQNAQSYLRSMVSTDYDFTELAEQGLAWTGDHNGEIIAMGGLIPMWENRALAWTLISENAGKHFKAVHKAVQSFLIHTPYRRIEANVDVGFKAGHRWMKMLGFEVEGLMKAYKPDGADMFLYARIRR